MLGPSELDPYSLLIGRSALSLSGDVVLSQAHGQPSVCPWQRPVGHWASGRWQFTFWEYTRILVIHTLPFTARDCGSAFSVPPLGVCSLASLYKPSQTSQLGQWLRMLLPMQETQVPSLGWEDLLEEEMATHSSILVWEIPWTEEPGGLQPMGSQRVGHDLAIEQQ